LGRETTKEVLLVQRLKKALIKINPTQAETTIVEAIKQLQDIGLNKDINKANMDIYDKLKNGIKLKITNSK
jgi:type I site-specific restriction-modification system R (restriction) subunit